MRRFKLLSILHYIWGGYFTSVGLAVFRVYFDYFTYENQVRDSVCSIGSFTESACESWVLIFTVLMHIFLLGFGIVNLWAAFSYQRNKPNTVNWIAACLNLFGMPIGTVLGIYSLYRLNNYFRQLQNSYEERSSNQTLDSD